MNSADREKLRSRLQHLFPIAIAMKSFAFRSAGVKYANESDFVSGSGAAYYGGRWNPIGMRAIYASLDPITAAREAYQNFTSRGFSPADIKPRVMAGIEFKCRSLLDLTAGKIRRRLGLTIEQILSEDWSGKQRAGKEPLTHSIAIESRHAGFEGILSPSAQDRNGKNIVIFLDSLQLKSFVRPISPEDLPPHPSLWPS